MRRFRILEAVSTKFLGLTVVSTIVLVVGAYVAVVHLGLSCVDTLAKFTDSVFKTVALLVGTLWAVNRYFTERTDAPQFRVDCEASMIRGETETTLALLVFRLDLVNTGKTQVTGYRQFVAIDAAAPTTEGVQLTPLYRWPAEGEGWHSGGVIEPGSWAAINDEVACSASVKAVRIFLAVAMNGDSSWTWHKTVDVSRRTP